jgi:pimeloyl-ACP methyl ester carboxylesterase
MRKPAAASPWSSCMNSPATIRSWEPQMRFFSRRYRCIAYPRAAIRPRPCLPTPKSYSQDRATDDIAAVIKGLGLGQAHVVGLSMGAFATLHLGLRHPRSPAA